MTALYEDYLKETKCLTLEEMQKIHESMELEIRTDPDALELYRELLGTAIRYAGIRARWPQLSREEKMEQDPGRTACHDSVIVKCNMLSRYLRMQGKKAAWRDVLGDETADPYDRKRIGDFACYLAFVNGLNAR